MEYSEVDKADFRYTDGQQTPFCKNVVGKLIFDCHVGREKNWNANPLEAPEAGSNVGTGWTETYPVLLRKD